MSASVDIRTFYADPERTIRCLTVVTERRPSETLAMIDHDSEGYTMSIFTLGQYTRRTHRRKTTAGAQSVLDKHLESEGYDLVTIEI